MNNFQTTFHKWRAEGKSSSIFTGILGKFSDAGRFEFITHLRFLLATGKQTVRWRIFSFVSFGFLKFNFEWKTINFSYFTILEFLKFLIKFVSFLNELKLNIRKQQWNLREIIFLELRNFCLPQRKSMILKMIVFELMFLR